MIALHTYDVFEILLVIFATGSVALGLFIGAQAYRGLRRHGEKRMLYLSVGMMLLFGAAYSLAFATSILLQFRVLALIHQNILRLTVRVLQFIGLAFIAYSMYAD
jgi:hypothetical protein